MALRPSWSLPKVSRLPVLARGGQRAGRSRGDSEPIHVAGRVDPARLPSVNPYGGLTATVAAVVGAGVVRGLPVGHRGNVAV